MNKENISASSAIVFLLTVLMVLGVGMPISNVTGQNITGKIFYISPDGSDTNTGTAVQPFATLDAARDAARKSGTANNRIVLLPGEYFRSKPFELDSKDNGLTIEAEKSGTVTIIGGSIVEGWKKGEDKFWYNDLSGVKEGEWDFRVLIVNGRMAERARFPETGTLSHKQSWDVKLLPGIAGYWERQPLPWEKLIMAYDPQIIPATFDIKNAEIRVYHMWNESMVGIAGNDTLKHVFTFSSPCIFPPGAFGIKKFVVFNTREGMTKPGQWYLDRTAGRVVYWPLKEEDMTKARVIVPRTEQIILIAGTSVNNIKNVTLRNLSFQATSIPLKTAGWAGGAFNGAVHLDFANQCDLEKLEIFNAGGTGLAALHTFNSKIVDCTIHHTGACGLKFNGNDVLISGNHLHDLGLFFPGSGALFATGDRLHIYRNEIFNSPYSGIIFGGSDNLLEENQISRVMQELHDGAAIYSDGMSVKRCILRGNLVRDIVEFGQGFGVSSFYFDEGSSNCLAERNISIGVGRPIHNHIASGITYRDNVFITDGSMTLSFARSADCTFERNTLIASGPITLGQPNAIKSWKKNIVYRNGQLKNGALKDYMIDSLMPRSEVPSRLAQTAKAVRVNRAPVLDGILEAIEWPGEYHTLNREPSRLNASGAPVLVKFSYDKKWLYVGANINVFDPENIVKGSVWQKNDGLELAIAGNTSKGKSNNYIIRIYSDGSIQSLTLAGVTDEAAKRLEKGIKYLTRMKPKQQEGGGWICELAIPLDLLNINLVSGTKIPFNLSVWCNEYGNWHCWEGTQGENWHLEKAGILELI